MATDGAWLIGFHGHLAGRADGHSEVKETRLTAFDHWQRMRRWEPVAPCNSALAGLRGQACRNLSAIAYECLDLISLLPAWPVTGQGQ